MPSCSTLDLSTVIFLPDGVDVNVTPDKRQVFVQEEEVLLATIKSSLRRMFDGGTASFDVNQKPQPPRSFLETAMATPMKMKTFDVLRSSKMKRYQIYLLQLYQQGRMSRKGNFRRSAVSRGSFHQLTKMWLRNQKSLAVSR